MQEEEVKLGAIRARCNHLFVFVHVFSWPLNLLIFILILFLAVSNVLKRHSELAERLSRLEGDQWNDGLLATIRERVHMEAERRSTQMPGDTTQLPIPFHGKITYKVGNKVICCLDGPRIGIQYDTSFAGESCDLYHCVLESKSFLEKMTVLEHTVPFFLPIHEAENEFLSSNAIRFIDHVGDLLQVRLIKELYGNQIGELYHSLPYNMIEFVLEDFDLYAFSSSVTVSSAYAEIVLNLTEALQDIFGHTSST
ncbi:unnamed protein product [Withania somnifera]